MGGVIDIMGSRKAGDQPLLEIRCQFYERPVSKVGWLGCMAALLLLLAWQQPRLARSIMLLFAAVKTIYCVVVAMQRAGVAALQQAGRAADQLCTLAAVVLLASITG